MFTIKDKFFEYIPVQYALLWHGKKNKSSSNIIMLNHINELVDYSRCEGNYIWDFQNIRYVNDRSFKDIFIKLKQRKCNVIFAHIEKDSALEKAMLDGISNNQIREIILDNGNDKNFCIGNGTEKIFEELNTEEIQKRYLSDLVEKNCIETEYQYLVSSGVYSNMQINLKKLFNDVNNFPYVIYLLWKRIYRESIDGLIATSKNGVAFASILGEILECEVYYYNIGQMFEETYNCSPAIKPNNKYIHIYDMICLGSETKVLHALVEAQKGEILKSIGCVCLVDLDIVKKKNRYSSMNKVRSLIGLKDLKKEYKISLSDMNGGW